MRALKQGFTIAEVTTAMAIVGIVAALVMPLAVKNLQKQQAGPILGRAVQQIELGCQNMIEIANSNVIDGSQGNMLGSFLQSDLDPTGSTEYPDKPLPYFNFENLAAPYMGLQPITLSETESSELNKSIDYFNGAAPAFERIRILAANKFVFSKLPASVYIFGNSTYNATMYQNADDLVATIYIDTNGMKKPNDFGKDLFRFELTNSCKMKPHGLGDTDHYTTNCSDTNIKDGKACAARVVADGFKIKYY